MGSKRPDVGINTYGLLSQICIGKCPVAQQRRDSHTASRHSIVNDYNDDKTTPSYQPFPYINIYVDRHCGELSHFIEDITEVHL